LLQLDHLYVSQKVSDIVGPGMKHPVVVAVSPSKTNMFRWAFAALVKGPKKECLNITRTIIYCQKLSDCSHLYMHFQKCLCSNFIEPEDAPDLPGF